MPTTEPLPHYASACQDQAHTDAQTTIHPIQMPCVKRAHRHGSAESSGVGWITAEVFGWLEGGCGAENAESAEKHSSTNITAKAGVEAADPSGH